MKLALFTAALIAFGLGYWNNLPTEEPSYDLADIQAMNDLTASLMGPQDWLSQLVEARHAQ